MKKVFFILSYSHLGGAETRAVDIAINLKDSCTPIFIIYGKKNGDVQAILDKNNIFYKERIPFNWKSKWRGLDIIFRLFFEALFIIKIYLQYRPKSMISFCADANIIVSFSNLFIQHEKTYWCQEDDFIQWRWKRLFKWCIKNSKNVIAVSCFIEKQILNKTKTRKSDIIIIDNSIDVSLLTIKKIESKFIRFSVIGHINKIKNQGFVIENIGSFIKHSESKNIELNIYGSISDLEYWKTIQKNEKWLKYRGYQSKNDIYNNTDIVIIASTTEASPLVLLESDYFNLPILCSNIPAFASLKNKNIYFFELNDNKSFNAQLQVIIQNEIKKNIFFDKKEIYERAYKKYINTYLELLTT